MKTYFVLVSVLILGACSSNSVAPKTSSSSSLFDISRSSPGKVLQTSEALTEIRQRQSTLPDVIKKTMTNGTMFYNGGYSGNADNSGAIFPVNCGQMVDGKFGCFRSGEQQMVSSGMAQFAPSKNARLNDLITLMYKVTENSLTNSGGGRYSDVQVETNAALRGDIAGKSVNKDNCVHVQAKDAKYRMSMEFYHCSDDSFYGRTQRNGNLVGLTSYFGIEKGSANSYGLFAH